MAKLSKGDVLHVAKLARLTLTESEVKKFGSQLSEVVNYIDQLSEVGIEGVEPTAQTTGLKDIDREDKEGQENRLIQEEATSGSGKIHNGYFIVPALFEGERGK